MVDKYYDEIAQGYEELHLEEQQKKISLIKEYFHPLKQEKLLDVGCGTGITTEPWDCERYGIDPSKKLIRKAVSKAISRNEKINYLIASAEHIPFPDKSFDHVISITAIQNFDDIKKGLNEIKRVGKNSFVLTFLKKSEKREMIGLLIEKNFKVIKKLEQEKDIIYFCE